MIQTEFQKTVYQGETFLGRFKSVVDKFGIQAVEDVSRLDSFLAEYLQKVYVLNLTESSEAYLCPILCFSQLNHRERLTNEILLVVLFMDLQGLLLARTQ